MRDISADEAVTIRRCQAWFGLVEAHKAAGLGADAARRKASDAIYGRAAQTPAAGGLLALWNKKSA